LNKLKESLRKDDITIGTWLQIPSPVVTEIIAQNSGGKFEWMCIDLEHGSIDVETMADMIRVMEKYYITPIVRIPKNDYIWIHRSLDAGAKGIVIPMVKSVDDANFALQESKYPPEGRRSFGYSRANAYGVEFWDSIKKANNEISVIIQIEHIDAIKNLASILEVPIDATFIGPLDLAGSMGLLDDMEGYEFQNTLSTYVEQSKTMGIPSGMHVIHPNSKSMNASIKGGYKMIAAGLDTIFLQEECRKVSNSL